MPDMESKGKPLNISIFLPNNLAAIIEHESIMRNETPENVLQEIVQKMFDDNSKEIANSMKC